MKYIICSICIALFVLHFFTDLTFLGYTQTSSIFTHFTYMFVHFGILHILFNLVTFFLLFKNLQIAVNQYILTAAMLVGGFLASFGSQTTMSTIGISGVVYFLLGAVAFYNINWKSLLIVALCLFSVFNPLSFGIDINRYNHLFGLIYGSVFIILYKFPAYYRKNYLQVKKLTPKQVQNIRTTQQRYAQKRKNRKC